MIIRKTVFTTLFISMSVFFAGNALSADFISDAQQYMAKGEYKAAIIQLKNQLKNDSEDSRARYLLGVVYLKTGENVRAEIELKKAQELDPGRPDISLSYAELLLFKKEYENVLAVLETTYAEKEVEQQRQLKRALAYLGLGQTAEAKQIFTPIAEQEQNITAYNGLARIALLNKETEATSQWIEKVLALEADNKEALQLKATMATIDKHYADALTIYNHLIRAYPDDLSLYYVRATIQLALNDLKAAEKDVNAILKNNKNQPQANFVLAQIKLREQKYRQAQVAAQKVLISYPQHYPSMLLLGIANFAQEHFNQAEKYIIQYLSSSPDDFNAQILLANVYLGMQQGEQALLILNEIDAEKRNSDFQILLIMGSAYMLTGEYEKGISAFLQAEKINPESELVQQKLLAGRIKLGKIDAAIESLEKIVQSDQGTRQSAYLLSLFYIQENEIQKAEAQIHQQLSKTPDDADFYNLLAAVEKLKGNDVRAESAYQRALQLDKHYIPAYLGLGKLAMSRGELEKARNYFRQILEFDEQNIKAYVALASIAEKTNDLQNAEQLLVKGFEKATGKVGSQIVLASELGNFYINQGKADKLLALAQKLAINYPENADVLSLLASAEIVNNKNGRAEETLKKIINDDHTDTKHRLMLANLLATQPERENEVIKLLDEVIVVLPNSTDPVMLKAAYLIKLQQYQQAMDVADYAQKQFPDLALGRQLKGEIFLRQKQYDRALESYQQAWQIQENNKILIIMADILVFQGKNAAAISLLSKALQKDSQNTATHLKLATIYQMNNQFPLAVKHYQTVLEMDRDNALALNNLALIYSQQKDPRAISLAKKAYEKVPDSADIADTYGYILVKQGQLEEGIHILEKAVEQNPDNNDNQYHLAESYFLNNQQQQAKQILEIILSSENSFSEKENAKILLQKIKT